MEETYTFVAYNNSKEKFQITVKNEFLKKCTEPKKHSLFELNSEYYLFKYLHNPSGPAVIKYFKSGEWIQFWLDGILIGHNQDELDPKDLTKHEKEEVPKENVEQYQQMLKNYRFNLKLEKELEKQ